MKTLKKMLQENKWDYINSDITQEHFPRPKKLRKGKVIVFEPKLTNGYVTSESILKQMKENNLVPLNLYEMLEWINNGGEMKDDKWYLAFGQLWKSSDGNHGVPSACRYSGGDREFALGDFEGDWNDDDCLLCFCDLKKSLEPKAIKNSLSPLETLTKKVAELERFKENVEKAIRGLL